MMDSVSVFPEPALLFANGQAAVHPRDGLTLFGPHDSRGEARPRSIAYGLIGTPAGLQAFRSFAARMARPILTDDKLEECIWPHFPGFEEAFHVSWDGTPVWTREIDGGRLKASLDKADIHERVYRVVNQYLEAVQVARQRDEAFHLFICVVPDQVYLLCRQQAKGRRVSGKERRLRSQSGDFFESFDPDQYSYSLDFRRQIKARVMAHAVPIQLVRESTLRLQDEESLTERSLTPLSDRAWNLSTAIYYKSGGRPWKLSTARDGVCYVGIAFKDTDDKGRHACSAAQMFLDDGDGVVFLGEYGRWYSEHKGEYHLTRKAARSLLEGVLKTYRDQHGKALSEVFIHSRSSINDEEYAGYQDACPTGAKVVGIRVNSERTGLRVYRNGTRPVLRGTFWPVTERRGFLWGSGFKPRLRTYDGSDVPQPLCIEIQHGHADITQVAKDVFGLTKLNYNCCKLGEYQPVTIHFSDAVGEILVANAGQGVSLPNFKYYI